MAKKDDVNSTSDIGGRISEVSAGAGGKKELAKKSKLSESQLHRIVSGQSHPKMQAIVLMAKAAGVNLKWLATGEGNKHPQSNSDFIKQNPPITADTTAEMLLKPPEYGMPEVERVHFIDVEAAIRGIIRADKKMGTFLVPKEQLEAEGLTVNDILLTPPMVGDCMLPTVVEGSMVVIAHKRKAVKDNSLYVLPISGDLALRRIQSDLQGGYIIKCDNPSYTDIKMTAEDFDQVKMTGQAVFMFGKL